MTDDSLENEALKEGVTATPSLAVSYFSVYPNTCPRD